MHNLSYTSNVTTVMSGLIIVFTELHKETNIQSDVVYRLLLVEQITMLNRKASKYKGV